MNTQTRELGRTGIEVSPIGLGCMQFSGKGLVAGMFFPSVQQSEVDVIIKTAIDRGITWFDTAEMYGRGRSEDALSTALAHAGVKPSDVTVATKWAPFGRTAKSIERTIDKRIAALDPFPVDLYQIHTSYGGFSTIRSQVRAMERLARAHEIGAVGVSNFSARQMEIAHETLAQHGIALATNQVQINLLNRKIETNGVLDTARRLGVTLIAYSPLRNGILTGKFHADRSLVANMPRFRRALFTSKNLDRTEPLVDCMRDIAEAHAASISQVALAWLITHYGDTVIAIPGASKPHHAEEAAGAMAVDLQPEDAEQLTELSSALTRI